MFWITTFHSKKALSLLNWTAAGAHADSWLQQKLKQTLWPTNSTENYAHGKSCVVEMLKIISDSQGETDKPINWLFYFLIRDTTLFSFHSLKGFILAKHSINITSYHYTFKISQRIGLFWVQTVREHCKDIEEVKSLNSVQTWMFSDKFFYSGLQPLGSTKQNPLFINLHEIDRLIVLVLTLAFSLFSSWIVCAINVSMKSRQDPWNLRFSISVSPRWTL